MSYLILPNLEVRAANALACPWIINAAPVMAATLFGHRLELVHHQETGGFLSVRGVAILHHDAQLLGEHGGDGFYRFAPQQRRGATFINARDYSSTNKNALSMQPTVSFHWRVSLVLDVEGQTDLTTIERFLAHAKLAGGEIVHHDSVERAATLDDARGKLPRGASFWLLDRRDLMEGHTDPLQALFAALEAAAPSTPDADEDQDESADSHGQAPELIAPVPAVDTPEEPLPLSWLTPAVLGYAALTDFAKRQGVRQTDDGETPPHAYCEPLIGLVQYVSPRDHGARPLPFWRHRWPQPDVFLVEQTQPSR